MAKRYDYTNIDFCERVLIRKDIQDHNFIINGIAKSVNYVGKPHTFIMESFFGAIKKHMLDDYYNNESPLRRFNLVNLQLFSDYLSGIRYYFNELPKELQTDRSFKNLIKERAVEVRKYAKENYTLPEHQPIDTPLPGYIKDSTYNKALTTLKQNNIAKYKNYKFKEINNTVYTMPESDKQTKKVDAKTVTSSKLKSKTPAKKKVVTGYVRPKSTLKYTTVEYISYLDKRLEKEKDNKVTTNTKLQDVKEKMSDARYEMKTCSSTTEQMTMYTDFKKYSEQSKTLQEKLEKIDKVITGIQTELETQKKLLQETKELPVLVKTKK